MKRGSLAGVLVLTLLVLAPPARAHVDVELIEPFSDARLEVVPDLLRFRLDETVDDKEVSVRVGVSGETMYATAPPSEVDGGFWEARVPARAHAGDASYLVEISATGGDGHPASEVFAFVVGDGPLISPEGNVDRDTGSPTSVWFLLRAADWIGIVAFVALAGNLVLLLCWKQALALTRVEQATSTITLLGVLAAAASAAVHGAYVAGLGPSDVPERLTDSLGVPFGRLMLLRFVVLLIWWWATARLQEAARDDPTRVRRRVENVAMVCFVVVALTFAGTSHAIAVPFGLPLSVLHVGAISVWMGGVAMVALALTSTARPSDWTLFLRTGSAAASVALISGGLLALDLFGGAPAGSDRTIWLILLATKLVLVISVLALGIRMRRALRVTGGAKLAGLLRSETVVLLAVTTAAGLLAWQPL